MGVGGEEGGREWEGVRFASSSSSSSSSSEQRPPERKRRRRGDTEFPGRKRKKKERREKILYCILYRRGKGEVSSHISLPLPLPPFSAANAAIYASQEEGIFLHIVGWVWQPFLTSPQQILSRASFASECLYFQVDFFFSLVTAVQCYASHVRLSHTTVQVWNLLISRFNLLYQQNLTSKNFPDGASAQPIITPP